MTIDFRYTGLSKIGLIVILLISVLQIYASALEPPKVEVRAIASHEVINRGGSITLFVEYLIPPETHLTQNFLEIKLEETQDYSRGLMEITPGVFEEGEVIRRNKAVVRIPLDISDNFVPGPLTVKGTASYQICTDGKNFMCFPPVEKPFEVTVSVGDSSRPAKENSAATTLKPLFENKAGGSEEPLDVRLKNALSEGSFLAFLIVFIAGFLTSLTPCVYPMIPITIGYIGGKSAGAGKWRGFILSVFYVLGLAIIYSILGVVAAWTGSLFGSITQTPIVIAVVSIIFLAMGLSMLGLFDISLPSSITTGLQSKGPRKGYAGSFIMGMVAGLVAAPCAGPVIVVLLAFIATTKSIVMGFTLMMLFALGMGILFLLLGTFSGLLTSLPQAGMWMEGIKKTFGIILLAAAVWIARPLIPPPIIGMIAGIGLSILGAFIGAFDRFTEDTSAGMKIRKAMGLLLFVCGAYITITLLPIPGKVIPQLTDSHSSESAEAKLLWNKDLEYSLIEAKNGKKALMLDFTADWCAACKELEHKTFTNPDVIAKLKQLYLVQIDCTDSRSDVVKARLEKYAVSGLPTLIVLDPEGNELSRVTSFLNPNEFLKFLESALTSNL